MSIAPCPTCGGKNLYKREDVRANGPYGPSLLPGAGAIFRSARFTVVVCGDCGLARYFAGAKEREQIKNSRKWKRI